MRALLHPELREAQRRRGSGSEPNIWTTQELVLAITETGVVAVLTYSHQRPCCESCCRLVQEIGGPEIERLRPSGQPFAFRLV